jgi:hypothetical protein
VLKGPQEFFQTAQCEGNDLFGWYEIIAQDVPCRWHLDLEISQLNDHTFPDLEYLLARLAHMDVPTGMHQNLVEKYLEISASPWTETQCALTYRFLCIAVQKFLKKQDLDRDMVVLTGCRATKFSLHMIFPNILLDSNVLSCRYLTWEFSRYLWGLTNREATIVFEGTDDTDPSHVECLLRLLMLEKQVDAKGWFLVSGVHDIMLWYHFMVSFHGIISWYHFMVSFSVTIPCDSNVYVPSLFSPSMEMALSMRPFTPSNVNSVCKAEANQALHHFELFATKRRTNS